MTHVLVLTQFFLPAFRAGGPVRTLTNLLDQLGGEIDFSIVAGDRDLGDDDPFADVGINVWSSVSGYRVMYVRNVARLASLLRNEHYDILYINSLFSRKFGIAPVVLRRLQLIPHCRVVLAPRGELSPGAVGLHTRRKRVFLSLAKAAGLYRGVRWQASSSVEAAEIRAWFGAVDIAVAPNPFAASIPSKLRRTKVKEVGRLHIAFLSRIAPKKNLFGALELLDGIEGDIIFDVFGPIEDANYWASCRARIRGLSSNVCVRHRGPIPLGKAPLTLLSYDVFLLPTLGENFGHAIVEALSAGCPVVISDTTPWRGLEARGVGWDIPLDRPDRFRSVLGRLVVMGQEEHLRWSKAAHAYATQLAADTATLEANRRLFIR